MMTISFSPVRQDTVDFMLNCLEEAFPAEERRERSDMQRIMKKNEFHPNLLYANGNPAGVLTYWRFPSFLFIEHFAFLPAMRGHGLGKEALRRFTEAANGLPVILEVEPPVTETAVRRISFYKACGFQLSDEPYEQPSYHKGGVPLSLRIMSSPSVISHELFLLFRAETRAVVYEAEDETEKSLS